jgi:osmotically-inducible protein OsmY
MDRPGDDQVGFCRASPMEETATMPFVRDATGESTNDKLTNGEMLAGQKLAITDEMILKLVYQALHASGYQQLRNLQANCHSGRVTLQGHLPTYYLKQVAQVAALSVDGVRDLDNDLKVISSW